MSRKSTPSRKVQRIRRGAYIVLEPKRARVHTLHNVEPARWLVSDVTYGLGAPVGTFPTKHAALEAIEARP